MRKEIKKVNTHKIKVARQSNYSGHDVSLLTKKIFDSAVQYNNFENIDFKRINPIIENILKSRDLGINNTIEYTEKQNLRYHSVANYIFTLEFFTYDEKMYILITTLDPNLVMLKKYLNSSRNMTSKTKLNEITDKGLKKKLEERNEEIYNKLSRDVKDKIGFFDLRFLRFEKDYFNKFCNSLAPEPENAPLHR